MPTRFRAASRLLLATLFLVPLTPTVPPAAAEGETFTMTAQRVGLDEWRVYIDTDRPSLTFSCTLAREDTRQPIDCPHNRPFTINADPSKPWRFEAVATDPDGQTYTGELNYQGQPTTPPGGDQPGGGTPPPPPSEPDPCTLGGCTPDEPQEPVTPVEPLRPVPAVFSVARRWRSAVSRSGYYTPGAWCPGQIVGAAPNAGCTATVELRARNGRRLDYAKRVHVPAGGVMQKRRISPAALRFPRKRYGRPPGALLVVTMHHNGQRITAPGGQLILSKEKGGDR